VRIKEIFIFKTIRRRNIRNLRARAVKRSGTIGLRRITTGLRTTRRMKLTERMKLTGRMKVTGRSRTR
jgi:hypothetical protein